MFNIEMEDAIHKHITIKKRHQKWIEENNINLSRFVQMKIEEEIKKRERK